MWEYENKQKFHLLVKNMKIMVTAASLCDFRLPPTIFFYQTMENENSATQTQKTVKYFEVKISKMIILQNCRV